MALKAGQTLGSWTFMKGLEMEKASQVCLKYSECVGNFFSHPIAMVDLMTLRNAEFLPRSLIIRKCQAGNRASLTLSKISFA